MLAAARVQANAAQAALSGSARCAASEPPPLYAYDPDVGRLAITTPTYNTAIVAVSRGAFPYGGVDLARLFDGRQEVAGGVGGRPPASFGVVVRGGGKMVAASQRAVEQGSADPLELLEAPRGTGATRTRTRSGRTRARSRRSACAAPPRPTGSRSRPPTASRRPYIETEWRVSGRRRQASIEVLFPSWGAGARVSAVTRAASGGR